MIFTKNSLHILYECNLKHIISIVLVSFVLLGFAGCSNISVNEAVPSTDTTAQDNSTTEGEKQALAQANDYLFSLGGFSPSTLSNQLEFEGFTASEIEYALENIDADWNVQCSICAQDFNSTASFSKTELKAMLEDEGFLDDQIDYALSVIY